MNGHISLESEYRDGTVVKIVIDQKIGIDPNAINQDDSIEECKRRVYLSKKVLIVDDDKINLKVASRLLMSYGVVTDEVSSGFQCIEKITGGEKYDLILLDDWMPQMGGVATLKQLKNIEGFNIPVVALTANAMAGMKDKYIKDGFDDFIPKPVERKELSRVMEKFLKEQ
jgi:CheY-like chemotaxis protein